MIKEDIWRKILAFPLLLLTLGVATYPLSASAETEIIEPIIDYNESSGLCANQYFDNIPDLIACALSVQIANNYHCRMTGVIIPIDADKSYLQMNCYYNGFNNPPTTLNNSSFASAGATCDPGYTKHLIDGTQVNSECRITLIINDQTSKDSCDIAIGNPIYPGSCKKIQSEVDYAEMGSPGLEYIRTYNSSTSSWSSNYDKRITLAGDSATLHWPDRKIRFLRSGSNWVADSDVSFVLTGSNNSFYVSTPYRNEREAFTSNNKITAIRTNSGVHRQEMTYSTGSTPTTIAPGTGYLIKVQTYHGQKLEFTYNSLGQRITMTDPAGQLYSYSYDVDGNLSTVTYPDGAIRTYVYNEPSLTGGVSQPNKLTGIVDENGARFASYAYDALGLPIMSEHAGGAGRVDVAYTTPPSVSISSYIDVPNKRKYATLSNVPGVGTQVTDALGTTRNYTFQAVNGASRVASSDLPCKVGCNYSAASQSYDANGNIASRLDFNGNETRYTHNARNLETSRTEAYGTAEARTISTSWHSTYRVPTQITEPGKTTVFTHDSNGNALTKAVTDSVTGAVRTWTYTFTAFNRAQSINGPRTDVSDLTTYVYSTCQTGGRCGELTSVTDALGRVTNFNTYNARGQLLTMTDPNGLVTTLVYDVRGRLTSRNVGGDVTAYEYWPTSRLKKTTKPDGSFLLFQYDNAHRLIRVDDQEGNHVVYGLDALGNVVSEEYYDGSSFLVRSGTKQFNGMGQLWKKIGSAGTFAVTTESSYDAEGNLTVVSAPEGRSSTRSYDSLNRLIEILDPANSISSFSYDSADNLLSVTDYRGKQTIYEYNGFGDLLEEDNPDSGVTTFGYSKTGKVISRLDARGVTGSFTYDALDRLTKAQYPGETINYTYDTGTNNKGRMMSMSDSSGSTSWAYDSIGRVVNRTQVMGVTKSVGYVYDGMGRLTTINTPSGNTLTYGYDDDKVVSITLNGSTVILEDATYEPFSGTNGWEWGNGTLAVRSFNADGYLTAVDSAGLYNYSYDNAFRVTAVEDDSDPTQDWAYAYDVSDRMSSASRTGLSQSWTYDSNGNRLSMGGSASSTYVISGANNRIDSVTGSLARTYSYDAAGNVSGHSGKVFSHSDSGRLVGVSGAVTASYAFNGKGQRVKKVTAAGSRYFVYHEDGRLLGEYDGAGSLIQETVWLGEVPVAALKPNGAGGVNLFYIHSDILNTPRRISRPSDNVVVWRWDSDPFGEALPDEDPDADTNNFVYDLRFPGQYFDGETGLMYNLYRTYDPAVGRYTQSDSLGLLGGMNSYSYVENAPVDHIDPYGLRGIPGYRPPNPAREAAGWFEVREEYICIEWHCPQGDSCRAVDYRRPTDFIPAAILVSETPPGCICTVRSFKKVFRSPDSLGFDDAVDMADAYTEGARDWRSIMRRMAAGMRELPWWHRIPAR